MEDLNKKDCEEIKENEQEEEKEEQLFTEEELKDEIKDDIKLVAKQEQRVKNFQRFILNVIITLTLIWLLFFQVIGITNMPNGDMFPRIDSGDLLLYYRLNKSPKEQDVIVLRKNDTEYVARVIAKGGDTVEITDDEILKVNGNALNEASIYETTPRYEGFNQYPLKLENGEYFVLVDKRNGGEDSRYYGTISKSDIKGIVITLLRRNNL